MTHKIFLVKISHTDGDTAETDQRTFMSLLMAARATVTSERVREIVYPAWC